MKLVDIHCHMLYGVDDGADSANLMRRMIDCAYRDGVGEICMTPHYNPVYFRCVPETVLNRYKEAVMYVSERYPDMRLYLGQEIYYHHDCVEELVSGKCLTLNRTRNVLVEFGPYDDRSVISAGVSHLLTSGFIPVIAHVERYEAFHKNKSEMQNLRSLGALIQVNAASILGQRGFFVKRFVMSLIKAGLVDIVADDCHDMKDKAPCLGEAYRVVCRKFGERTGRRLFVKNPHSVLCDD